ncbi:MAG: hypothetical protein ACR2HG_04465 [Pyrinomonadaceae bacterium]
MIFRVVADEYFQIIKRAHRRSMFSHQITKKSFVITRCAWGIIK